MPKKVLFIICRYPLSFARPVNMQVSVKRIKAKLTIDVMLIIEFETVSDTAFEAVISNPSTDMFTLLKVTVLFN